MLAIGQRNVIWRRYRFCFVVVLLFNLRYLGDLAIHIRLRWLLLVWRHQRSHILSILRPVLIATHNKQQDRAHQERHKANR